jgi:hypothetical protein
MCEDLPDRLRYEWPNLSTAIDAAREIERLRAELTAERARLAQMREINEAQYKAMIADRDSFEAELAATNARAAEGEREFRRYIRELDERTERAEAADARAGGGDET